MKLAFPELHDGGIIEVLFGSAFDGTVDFAGGGGGRKSNAELIGEVQGEAEVFVHQAQWKTGDVLAFQEIGSFDVEDARAGHAGLHNFDEFLARDASASGERESFGESVDLQCENHVHGELDGLTSSVWAEVK